MNILAIGNSFTQDGVRYLRKISQNQNNDMLIVSLVIGGCSLADHYRNMKADNKCYQMEFNGEWTGFFMGIKEVMLGRKWDVVTIQQFSVESTDYEKYQPYLNLCMDYIREYCPGAKIYLQQTWSYENGSAILKNWTNYKDTEEMFVDTKACYEKALIDCKADGLIPSGEVILELMRKGYKMHRDGLHVTLGLGRYALSLLWYSYLSGKSIDDVSISDFDEPISDEEIADAKATVNKVLGR